jgi:RNA polymerase sigma factor (sigma-70 family)
MRTDDELMLAHARGDPDAFEELHRRHAGAVLRFMRKDLWRAEAAHDLTQQTFLQLHRSRHDFRASGTFLGWLLTIARNLKYTYMRQVRRRPPTVPIEAAPVAEDESERRLEARDTLERALETLPENQRIVIRLYWLEHRSYPEIARRLGVKESAVRVRAHRAYRRLREHLGPSEERRDDAER